MAWRSGVAFGSPLLATDPLRPSAEGAQPPESGPLTPFVARRCAPRTLLNPRPRPGPVFQRARPFSAAPEPLLFHVGLARRQLRSEAPSIGLISSLATRADGLLTNVFVGSLPALHPFTCRELARLVTDWATASRYLAWADPPCGWPFLAKEMPLTDFCNCNSRHEHLLERSTLEVPRSCDRDTTDGVKHPSSQLEWPRT
jgi:hypothetical protein